ncbi:MAG: Cypemycin methyltransferase [Planctomycetota bacterium]|jgi:SAM-dependent methyltransferase
MTDPYDAPRLWDLAFHDETRPEAEFLTAVALQHLNTSTPRTLEIGCGGGRQVLELARRGCHVSALDLNPHCVRFVQQRLKRAKLAADIQQQDMRDFRFPRPFQLLHCLVNTFRHLLTEADARQHLQCAAAHLEPGGLYVLGLHLLPPDAAEFDCERWTVNHRQLRITTTIRVLEFSRRKREELLRFSLKATQPGRIRRFQAEHRLRIYRADQFRKLLHSVPQLQLIGVFDFCYEADHPLQLNDQLGDAVFVLKRT